jgi:hypothetical protein
VRVNDLSYGLFRQHVSADDCVMALHLVDIKELVSEESLGHISAEEFEEARRDPDVISLRQRALRVLADRQAGRPHRVGE